MVNASEYQEEPQKLFSIKCISFIAHISIVIHSILSSVDIFQRSCSTLCWMDDGNVEENYT